MKTELFQRVFDFFYSSCKLDFYLVQVVYELFSSCFFGVYLCYVFNVFLKKIISKARKSVLEIKYANKPTPTQLRGYGQSLDTLMHLAHFSLSGTRHELFSVDK